MFRRYFFLLLTLAAAVCAEAEDATNVIQRMLAHRAQQDFSLQGRLDVTRDQSTNLTLLVHNTPTETRTIFRAGTTELLIVQPVTGMPRWFLRGTGELTGTRLMEKWLGSEFTFYDLGMPFLRWPDAKLTGEARARGQDCLMLELTATNQPYGRVKLWVEQRYFALLRAEVFDQNEALVRRLAITSFKRLGEVWIPRGIEMSFIPPHQSLPAEEKSRLEFYTGDYDAKLPAEWFAEENF
ncbi:MAG: outer membrane lipoprotein-sorting protein [Verrucomicrobiota bacterium]|jgi:negative regulator of sigma E activity